MKPSVNTIHKNYEISRKQYSFHKDWIEIYECEYAGLNENAVLVDDKTYEVNAYQDFINQEIIR